MRLRLEIFVILTMVPQLVPAIPLSMVHGRGNYLITKNDDMSIVHYLVKFGHLEDKLDVRNYLRSKQDQKRTEDPFRPYSEDEIKTGIKSFQNSFGLKPTGHLDEDTANAMKNPRCGVPDKGKHARNSPIKIIVRYRRYVKQGSKWPNTVVTWTIFRYLKSRALSRARQKAILEKAFKIWEYASPLKFSYTNDMNNTDIIIQFVSGFHGHKPDFDGVGNVLAHASFPSYGGDIHFDADEKWGIDISLLNVAVHEIGHSIGLKHSNVYDSIMYATYRVRRSITLDADDKAGVRAIYGQCQTKLDGAASIWGSTYFFRRGLVWKINDYDSKLISGYPKTMSNEFSSSIPTSVDATLVWSDNIMYFLKDSRTVGYDIYSKSVKYDNTIEYDWPGIPNDIDASLTYRDDKVTYFFKGNQYWKFDDTFFHVANGYPRKISDDWSGIPNNIDAAFYSEWYQKTFFFKGTEYWEFDVKLKKANPQGSIAYKWKNVCSAKY